MTLLLTTCVHLWTVSIWTIIKVLYFQLLWYPSNTSYTVLGLKNMPLNPFLLSALHSWKMMNEIHPRLGMTGFWNRSCTRRQAFCSTDNITNSLGWLSNTSALIVFLVWYLGLCWAFFGEWWMLGCKCGRAVGGRRREIIWFITCRLLKEANRKKSSLVVMSLSPYYI